MCRTGLKEDNQWSNPNRQPTVFQFKKEPVVSADIAEAWVRFCTVKGHKVCAKNPKITCLSTCLTSASFDGPDMHASRLRKKKKGKCNHRFSLLFIYSHRCTTQRASVKSTLRSNG